jgi:energy-coupling factor transport system permease protein
VIRVALIRSERKNHHQKLIKLDPRTKLLMLLLMSLLSFMIQNIYLLISISVVMLLLALAANISWQKFVRYVKPTLWLLPMIFLILLISPITNLGPSVNIITNFGFMSSSISKQVINLSIEAIIYALNSCIRILNLAIGSCLFSLTTNSNEYLQSLTKIAIPYSIAFTTGLVIYFLPMVVSETNETRMALETRGISMNRGSFITRVKNLRLLLTTILLNFVEKARYQAIALDSRGFNPKKKRSYYRTIKLELIDISVMNITIGLFCLICYIFRFEIITFFSFAQYFS